ncbi:MAG: aldo/keto reductase [Spirochaetota bacterium]
MKSLSSTVELNNGVHMPWVGLGVFQSEPGTVTYDAVRSALDTGYRHIDTATFYRNEADVGKALAEHPVPREEVFVTTKVWNDQKGYDATLRAFDYSMEQLGLDVLDLYLIHWPIKDSFLDRWQALERLYKDGRIRAIGVSNFFSHHLQQLMDQAEVVPAVNQVEFHPRLIQKPLLEFCRSNGIQLEAWSPLMRGGLFDNPVVAKVASEVHRTQAQVLIRWGLQHSVVTIPKSVNPERIKANAQVFDFELNDEQMKALDSLDDGHRIGPNPDELGGWK